MRKNGLSYVGKVPEGNSFFQRQTAHEAKAEVGLYCSVLNLLISNFTLQILLSYCHTLLIAETERIS